MSTVWPLFVIGVQLLVGMALLTLMPNGIVRGWTRSLRAAFVLLLGVTTSGLIILEGMLFGANFSVGWWLGLAASAIFVLLVNLKRVPDLLAASHTRSAIPMLLRFALVLGVAILITWNVSAALCLPTTDYDGLAIWAYRDRVILAERTIYTPSLRDPARIAPMPRHPYFLPVLEVSYCALSGFQYALSHIPHIVFYIAYLLLVIGVTQILTHRLSGLLLLASMLLMPAMSVQFWVEGPREPVIGVLAFAATICLTIWLERPDMSALIIGSILVSAAHQTKVEGSAIAAGYYLAVAIATLSDRTRFRERLIQLLIGGGLALVLALPWQIAKATIPYSPQDYDLTQGFGSGWLARIPHFLPVVWMAVSEMFFRLELYGLAPIITFAVILLVVRSRPSLDTLLPALPALVCFVGVLAIYLVRQTQLEAIRNVTFSRRFVCIIPPLIFAVIYAYDRNCMPGLGEGATRTSSGNRKESKNRASV